MPQTNSPRVALEPQLARFRQIHFGRLQQCARVSRRVADLAFSHPLLFSALATHYGPLDVRLEVVRRAELGRPLAEVAAALGLPACLKRIPPEACVAPLSYVRWSGDAGRFLGQQVPDGAHQAAGWLKAVFYCAAICGEVFAQWVCRQTALIFNVDFDLGCLRPLALFAWHSLTAESPLHGLAFKPWSSRMGFQTAVSETKLWLNRVKLYVNFHDTPIVDTWLDAGHAGGFDFIPLTSCQDILDEGTGMRNCLHSYADPLARNACRIFSVREGGRRVATLELAPPYRGAGTPFISQLKGPDNSEPSRLVYRAAQTWLDKAEGWRGENGQPAPLDGSADNKLRALLAPYGLAVAAPAYLDSSSDLSLLQSIVADLAALARWTRVSGRRQR